MSAVAPLNPLNTTWEARECMVFLGNDGGISLRNVINGKKHAKRIAYNPTLIDQLRGCVKVMEEQCRAIDSLGGLGRTIIELYADGDMPKELIAARALLAELGETS